VVFIIYACAWVIELCEWWCPKEQEDAHDVAIGALVMAILYVFMLWAMMIPTLLLGLIFHGLFGCLYLDNYLPTECK
jgi:hypothetical protein